MDAAILLRWYDRQLRAGAEVADADEVVRVGPVWAATYPRRGRGFVTYRAIPAALDLDALIGRVLSHYVADERVDRVEWKTRGHDPLPVLLSSLVAHGFLLGDVETVMAGEVAAVIAAGAGVPDGYRVEQASTPAHLREAASLAGRVFGETTEESRRRADDLVERLRRRPDGEEVWLARESGGQVVCSGRVEFVAGTTFAGLWGGACDPAHRGRGLYRAVTAARAVAARRHGKRYLQSDCTAFSRGILVRAGMLPITTSIPAVWRRPG